MSGQMLVERNNVAPLAAVGAGKLHLLRHLLKAEAPYSRIHATPARRALRADPAQFFFAKRCRVRLFPFEGRGEGNPADKICITLKGKIHRWNVPPCIEISEASARKQEIVSMRGTQK